MKCILRGIAFLCFLLPGMRAIAATEPVIRVQLLETSTTLAAKPIEGTWRLVIDAASLLLVPNQPTTITLENNELRISNVPPLPVPAALRLVPETSGALIRLSAPGGRSGYDYPGPIEILRHSDSSISAIAEFPMEEYLRGVVPHEIGLDSPHQAKCAQAVAARSFALLALERKLHEGRGFHLCSTVCCQVYGGLGKSTSESDKSITETRGYALTFEGNPIPAYYAGNCGGHTEDIRVSWPSRNQQRAYHGASRFDGPDAPKLDLSSEADFKTWLASKPKSYCNSEYFDVPEWASRNIRWTREVSADDLTKFVALRKDIGRVVAIKLGERGDSGRLKSAEFVGENGVLSAGPEYDIRRVFRPYLRSGAFIVEPRGGTPERPESFYISGAGSGHGVGMCQTGAMGMANDGKDFTAILKHYYPNASVEKVFE